MAELNAHGIDQDTFVGFIDGLNEAFVAQFNDPKFVAYLDKQAVVAAPTSPEDFVAFLKQDRKDAETLIRTANARKQQFKE